jgi:ribose/xylose/arabinose/galactoside ABC-type transport system permease subunit
MIASTEPTRWPDARPSVLKVALHPDVIALATLVIGFASASNFRAILLSVAVIACMALGENLVILGGEIDVSVGSIMALAGFVAGPIAISTGSSLTTLAVGVGVGLLAGLVNGLIISRTPIPSIVATLGTLYIFQGAALVYSGTHNVVSVPDSADILGAGSVFGIPLPVVVVIVAFALLAVVRRNTKWGRDLIAMGDNRRAARTMGIPISRELLIAFVLSGAMAGLGAVLYLGELGGIQTSVVGTNLVLQVIAACAIGGTSIRGGRGSDLAPLIGALLISVITDGVVILGVPGVWIPCAYGAAILIAVARDRLDLQRWRAPR